MTEWLIAVVLPSCASQLSLKDYRPGCVAGMEEGRDSGEDMRENNKYEGRETEQNLRNESNGKNT